MGGRGEGEAVYVGQWKEREGGGERKKEGEGGRGRGRGRGKGGSGRGRDGKGRVLLTSFLLLQVHRCIISAIRTRVDQGWEDWLIPLLSGLHQHSEWALGAQNCKQV